MKLGSWNVRFILNLNVDLGSLFSSAFVTSRVASVFVFDTLNVFSSIVSRRKS